MKTALITGITGQDGSYLAEFLLARGYNVTGFVRRTSLNRLDRIDHLGGDEFTLLTGDLTDQGSITSAISACNPDEIYNLGSQSFVKASWDIPVGTADATGLGAARVFEAVRTLGREKDIKIYQAGSSEMFGAAKNCPQTETDRFYPRSPYACAKVYAHYLGVNYRDSYDMFIANGLLYNHESPRRGIEFVTRKITDAVAAIAAGKQTELRLGNLDVSRDWGHAQDYIVAMWLMLQQDTPDDYIIATGQMCSVRNFCRIAFEMVGLDYEKWVVVDERYFRPAEVYKLQGDASKAKKVLGWEYKIGLVELIRDMLTNDLIIHGVYDKYKDLVTSSEIQL